MRFRKMHGLGNDFVILDQTDVKGMLTNAQIQHICDRHFGVGCDQLVVLEPSKNADVFARFFNADGSESGACGNATRCVADIVMSQIGQPRCVVETTAGVLNCKKAGDLIVEVDMGPAFTDWKDIPLSKEVDTLELPIGGGDLPNPVGVSMGNPHCVFFVDSLEDIDVERLGSTYEQHSLFPKKTNVEFVEIQSDTKMRQKTWERGSGLTLACGSGACAVAVAAVRRGLTKRKVEIELDGGTIQIEWRENDGHVLMTGPVAYVFDGTIKGL